MPHTKRRVVAEHFYYGSRLTFLLKLEKIQITVFVSVKVWPIQSMILFTNPSDWAGYDTRSTFKRSLTGLNSEFSFS